MSNNPRNQPRLSGYLRQNGEYGIRNYVLIISTVVCANEVVRQIANQVKGVKPLIHQHGCAQLAHDEKQTRRVLAGFGRNANVGAVLIVGLGCESNLAYKLADAIRDTGKPVEYLVIQEVGGFKKTIAEGVKIAQRFKDKVDQLKREPMPLQAIKVALECGASDATSGISANPAIGLFSDRLVAQGGTVVLSEVMEMIGAEHVLSRRAINPQVGKEILALVQNTEKSIEATGYAFRGANPTPGNMDGGLTTIEEKSLGCITKAGSAAISGVLGYAETLEKPGLYIMDTPGHDIESISGMIAGGAQICVFSTGLGTPTGSPIAPVIKVCGNPTNALRFDEFVDINAGKIIDGKSTTQEVADEIFEELISIVNGKKTKSETLGTEEFAINRIGPSL
ncbi:MAG: UxaA family hydrolase [Anaerolineaceae bacterium]|jgi:altronate dehydratase large subunit